jgi:hypothetical protein
MSKPAIRPYLIAKDGDGNFRVTLRETRLNSQGYPLVTATLLPILFATATAARTHVRDEYRGVATDIATK